MAKDFQKRVAWAVLGLSFAAIFGLNFLAALIPLEKLSWLFAVVAGDLALVAGMIQFGRRLLPKAPAEIIRVDGKPCPADLYVAYRHPVTRLVGRDAILADLSSALLSSTGSRVRIIAGALGVGKSRVAQAVAECARAADIDVWHISAASKLMLTCGMCAFAVNVGSERNRFVRFGNEPPLVRNELQAYLESGRQWLLIIDDLDDLDLVGTSLERMDGSAWLFEPRHHGMIIITTRDTHRHAWNPQWTTLHELSKPNTEDALKIFLQIADSDTRISREFGGKKDAAQLVKALGHLPAALWLTGKYFAFIQRNPLHPGLRGLPRTFSAYTSALSERAGLIRETASLLVSVMEEDADGRNLVNAWDISLELIASEGLSGARPLLGLLGAVPAGELSTYRIKPELFGRASRSFHPLRDPHILAKTITRLTDFGLLESRKVGKRSVLEIPSVTRDLVRVDPELRRIRQEIEHLAQLMVYEPRNA